MGLQIITYSIWFLLFAYGAMIVYYFISWLKILDFEFDNNEATPSLTFTIIIPARNEEKNIGACLDAIVNQRYPSALIQTIVVDDHSTDNTANIVRAYQNKRVELIQLSDYVSENGVNSYKKKAIEIAVKNATGRMIVTTDADCVAPANWLATIAAFHQKTDAYFLVMPVVYQRNMLSFLSAFQSIDFMTMQGITGASVNSNVHSMCNGANLAYTKSVFEQVNGFEGIDFIASGDDMMLMHKVYQSFPDKIAYLKSREVVVKTAATASWKDFFSQRIRWASKADKYEDKRIFIVLLLVYLFNLSLLLLPITFLYYPSLIKLWWMIVGIKTIVELFFLIPVSYFFSNMRLLWWFPIAQPFHIIYIVIAGWLGKFGNYQWKGRIVR